MLLTFCMQMTACKAADSRADLTDAPQEIQTSELTAVQTESSVASLNIDKDICISEIKNLREEGLQITFSDDSYECLEGNRDFFSEAETKYLQLLDSFSDNYEKLEIFGGAYYQNGYLNVLTTDINNPDILGSVDEENVIVRECRFSYLYLRHIEKFIKNVSVNDENVNCVSLMKLQNYVFVTVANDTVKSELYDKIREAGLDTESAKIIVSDAVVANPA